MIAARILRIVVALPAVLGGIAAVVVVGALFGWHPLWSEPDLTLAEAAALKDRGTMRRLLLDGADPNARERVRAGILKDDELLLTPLEASVGTRTPDALRLLLAHGARFGESERAVVFCLATKDEAREILDLLRDGGTAPTPDCEHVATPW